MSVLMLPESNRQRPNSATDLLFRVLTTIVPSGKKSLPSFVVFFFIGAVTNVIAVVVLMVLTIQTIAIG